MGVLKFSQRSEEVVLKEVWQRFVHLFIDQNPSEVEEAMSGVLGDKMPKIVQVPREAEELALSLGLMVSKWSSDHFHSKILDLKSMFATARAIKKAVLRVAVFIGEDGQRS